MIWHYHGNSSYPIRAYMEFKLGNEYIEHIFRVIVIVIGDFLTNRMLTFPDKNEWAWEIFAVQKLLISISVF